MTGPRVGAVIVNYNCAPFAVDAALSVLGAAGGDAEIVIVDNASPDSSAEYFCALAGGIAHEPSPTPPGLRLAGRGDARIAIAETPQAGISIVLSRTNGGFASGCNIGLKALRRARLDLILLLNPDAMIAEGAIAALNNRLADPEIGLCGASVLQFEPPHAAQAFGGARLHQLTLLGENLGGNAALDAAPPTEEIEKALDYPLGAAIALRPDYIDRAGFLDERYFLYYEEADWAFAGRAFSRVGWARDAIVYHRYGASSKSAPSARSPLSDYHMARSRLQFALKWRPELVPALVAMGGLQAARRLMRGRSKQARAVALGSIPGAARLFPA